MFYKVKCFIRSHYTDKAWRMLSGPFTRRRDVLDSPESSRTSVCYEHNFKTTRLWTIHIHFFTFLPAPRLGFNCHAGKTKVPPQPPRLSTPPLRALSPCTLSVHALRARSQELVFPSSQSDFTSSIPPSPTIGLLHQFPLSPLSFGERRRWRREPCGGAGAVHGGCARGLCTGPLGGGGKGTSAGSRGE